MKKIINISGMTCVACKNKIEKSLNKKNGVNLVNANYSKNTVLIDYDEKKISYDEIIKALSDIGYEKKSSENLYDKIIIILSVLIIFVLLYIFNVFKLFSEFPTASEGVSLIGIFIIGLLTSVHCVSMCGGICLSQCAKVTTNKFRPSFLYNLGRIVSYTLIGGIIGGLGSIISLGGNLKGLVMILAGIFMIIMGINMLDLFPFLKNIKLNLPKFINSEKENSAFYVGLLNGFMPCGPLQAMQLYALSTASVFMGALSMFVFALGTSLLLFGFGVLSSMLTNKFRKNMLVASGVMIIILGGFMLSNGLSLSGVNTNVKSIGSEYIKADIIDDEQVVVMELNKYEYKKIVVQKGIKVKWIVNAKNENITGCNNEIICQKFNISLKLKEGENITYFTPNELGAVPYSCWMGMINSQIIVVDDLDNLDFDSL